jgi:DNA-binding NarL/FixJ family response regulator
VRQERRPRILLADDYPGLIVALQRLLSRSCEVVGSVSSGRDAVAAAAALRPDVVVLDLTLPDMSGLEACGHIRLASPGTIIVVLTAIDDVDVRARALDVGASAFLVKQSAAGELESTIHRLLAETRRDMTVP